MFLPKSTNVCVCMEFELCVTCQAFLSQPGNSLFPEFYCRNKRDMNMPPTIEVAVEVLNFIGACTVRSTQPRILWLESRADEICGIHLYAIAV